MAVRRVGVLGGTFDPVHRDHLAMARVAAAVLDLDKVLFVPVGVPSHRDPPEAGAAARCDMVQLALAGEHSFELSRVDVDRAGLTRTVDTLGDLRAEHGPATELHLLVGADNLNAITRWRGSAEIFREACVVGCSRPGYWLRNPGVPARRLTLLDVPKLDVSATKIRRLVRDERPVGRYTTEAVARYISVHGFYSEGLRT